MSHHCISCGNDLSWIRAVPDPHYGLPVVVCPACDVACTRRKPPIFTAIRRFKAARRTAVTLLAQFLTLALLAGMSVTIIRGLAGDAASPATAFGAILYGMTNRLNEQVLDSGFEQDPEMIRTILVVFLLVSIGAGAWIRSAHGHLRLWVSVLCWFALIIGLLGIGYGEEALSRTMNMQNLHHLTISRELGAAAVFLFFTVPFVALGLPLGTRARKIWIKQYSAKAHKYRRKLRKHRMSNARHAAR